MNAPIVEINSLSKYFGSQTVLKNLDWQVHPGQVIGLLGRNGVGKSTLIESMLGLREIDGGKVRVFGESVDCLSDVARARIGYVPQQSDLFEWLTIDQMLDYFKALYPRWNPIKVEGLLERWSIGPLTRNKTIGRLSVGEKQRVSIIRALAHDPELLILDEPVSSLDPIGRREFLRELIDGVIERDTTVVFSTHILSDLERVALDVAFLKDGKIALQAPLDDLLESARRITGPSAALERLRLPGEIRRMQTTSGVTDIIARMDRQQASALQATDSQLQIEAMSLEDLFVEVTQ